MVASEMPEDERLKRKVEETCGAPAVHVSSAVVCGDYAGVANGQVAVEVFEIRGGEKVRRCFALRYAEGLRHREAIVGEDAGSHLPADAVWAFFNQQRSPRKRRRRKE